MILGDASFHCFLLGIHDIENAETEPTIFRIVSTLGMKLIFLAFDPT
jgi:hypothetical protein